MKRVHPTHVPRRGGLGSAIMGEDQGFNQRRLGLFNFVAFTDIAK
jgi:hypothetical protein